MSSTYKDMNIEELWKEYILIETKSLRDEIILRNVHFAEKLAKKKSNGFENILYPIEDAICSANIGLIQAFDSFDPLFSYLKTDTYLDRPINSRFLGWASLRINGEIVEGYRKSCWHNPRASAAKTHSLAPVMFSTIESYSKYNRESSSFDPENSVNETEENISHLTYKDFLEDYQDDCFGLNDNQKTVMDLFYIHGLKQNQISETLNETVSFVQTQKAAAIKKIKKLIKQRSEENRQRKLSSPKTHAPKGLVCR